MTGTVYLDGQFKPLEEACVPVMDRGFLFGDSVYEVIPVYGGHLFRLDAHLDRFARSLTALGIDEPMSRTQWREVFQRLIAQRGTEDSLIYVQVTRGVGGVRDHAPGAGLVPTVFAMAKPYPSLPDEARTAGLSAITLDDIRWARCDIKSTTLLANVLARKQASAEGVDEAILIRDGQVTEGAASNVFVVMDGLLVTPPKTNAILGGITREFILELAADAGIPFAEASIGVEDLNRAEEIWITSSSKEALPITRLNGRTVGNGKAGPLWHRMDGLYAAAKQRARMSA